MASVDRSIKKDKNQNIQVFVRVRPLNVRERAIRSHSVLDVVNNREVVVRQSHTKRFTFDRAFGPDAEQVEVYKEVVSPLIAEVLAGYNCTVFAYGQTGTGKTHTMVGESSGADIHWQNDPLAGIIPRALSQLFDELRISNTEYNVRVSYLELYNEELCDLLSSSTDNSKLRIYEDVNRKGSTIVNGLEEITVYNKNDVYDIMTRGQERKKVASTLMNSQSSRSHTVFTIVVHIKENSSKGEELVKIGKLNLVDLAGSENISKAGSDNPGKKERARECVNINQSLLTLGRVITALVEKHPHIPYRESKLTRILQESLGGRTKTSIIATVSPGHKDLEETMSTLEYANRAKNIQNKPEVNQKLTKQAVLKEYAEEVDKLKRELFAAREKNGVYLPPETYEEMNLKHDEQRREIQELLLKKRAMEEERERMESVFRELEMQHERAQDNLMSTRSQLDHTMSRLMEESSRCMEQQQLVSCLQSTERELTAQARELLAAADAAATDTHALHDNVDRRRNIESNNQQAVKAYRDASTAHRNNILGAMQHLANDYNDSRNKLQAHIDDQARDTSMTQEMNIQDLKLLIAKLTSSLNDLKVLSAAAQQQMNEEVQLQEASLQQCVTTRSTQIQQLLTVLVERMSQCVQGVKDTDVVGMVDRSTAQWLSGATGRVSCLQRVHGAWWARAAHRHAAHAHAARRAHAHHVAALQRAHDATQAAIQQREQDVSQMRSVSQQRLQLLQQEYHDSDTRLQDMIKHLVDMRTKLQEDMTRRKNDIESELASYCDITGKRIEKEREELTAITQAKEKAIADLQMFCDHHDECVVDAKDYDTQFGEGVSAISAEMEAFSSSVGHIVAHNVDVLREQLDKAEECLKESSKEIAVAESESSSQFVCSGGGALHRLAESATHAVTDIVTRTQESTTSAVETLSTVNERSSRLASEALQIQSSASSALCDASGAVSLANEVVRKEVNTHADMEGRYLMRDYVVYSPTGATPVRREYRYPRRLAATSPHDRILARLRHQRHIQQQHEQDSPASDCIVIEGDEYLDRNISDSDEVSESSASEVSEDSGVAQQ